MIFEKELVIFANSVKTGQHCVAGKEIKTKQWVRPVSSENGGSLSDSIVKYPNKGRLWEVKPLDKILIKFNKPAPLKNQPDNWMISEQTWETRYKITRDEVYSYRDTPENLWLKQDCLQDRQDRVDFESIKTGNYKISQSLYLIFVDKINLYTRNRLDKGLQTRGNFEYNGMQYDFALTDPNFFHDLNQKTLENKFLCISLGAELNGYCYKIIASVI